MRVEEFIIKFLTFYFLKYIKSVTKTRNKLLRNEFFIRREKNRLYQNRPQNYD